MTKTVSKTTANASIAQAQYKAMAAVAKKVKTWNDTSYKKATDELYALLAECYSVTLTTRAQSTSVMRELNKLLVEKGLTFNDGTKLETKVVRVVFGNIGKRAHIYARVLMNAREQAVDAKEFAKWLTAQGGVEAVRRQHKGLTPTQVKGPIYLTSQRRERQHVWTSRAVIPQTYPTCLQWLHHLWPSICQLSCEALTSSQQNGWLRAPA